MSAYEANTLVEPDEARPLERDAEPPALPSPHRRLRRVLIAAGVLVLLGVWQALEAWWR